MMKCVWLFWWLSFFSAHAFAVDTMRISVEQIDTEQGEISDFTMDIDLNSTTKQSPSISFFTKIKPNASDDWLHVNLMCAMPQRLFQDDWSCTQGLLQSPQMHIPFDLQLTPIANGVDATLMLKEADFSDRVGLHAAEKLTGDLWLKITKIEDGLRWENTLNWTGGEMYWQPFFLKGGGHQFMSAGVLKQGVLTFDQGHLKINQVGTLNFKGEMLLKNQVIMQLEANLPDLDLATAYPILFQPLLTHSSLTQAEMAGNVALKASIKEGELKALDIRLKDVDIEDENQKFAFYKLNAHIPWDYDEAKSITLSYLNGHLLHLPLGATDIQAQVNRYAWTAPHIKLPILDGALNLSDISAARIGGHWYWHLGANIQPIDMAQLTGALKLPIMQGKASAQIPQVTYSGGILTTNGEMEFNVFDGQAVVEHLVLINPLSNSPKLNADMHLHNLDLGQLTNTFSFGSIQGRLDGEVADLKMDNWQPLTFNAYVKSSPGNYRKKISQRAVENISALGGAGAAAAVQRSFLRFFEAFNYEKIGLSCKLSHNICLMDGLESTDGGYTIVKGWGIPAITVKGYNHTVGWSDLLGRIKRITDGNTQAIVQ